MDLIVELQRVTQAFDAEGLAYAVCGGLAVAVHGAPRATTDLDLLIAADEQEAALALARSLGFTFEAAPRRFSDGMEIRRVTQIREGQALTLDLLLDAPNLGDVLADRVRLELDGQPLWVVSRDGLIRMKLASNRPQDAADVHRLLENDR